MKLEERPKYDEKKNFFVVCDKCGNKIFEHNGYMEHPKGFYSFAVKCNLCGAEFIHKMATEKAHIKKQQEELVKQLNVDLIKRLTKKIMGDKE